jgi:hypothetical protein
MPLQNRVTPSGEIIVTAARGLFMGNRGSLHDAHRELRQQFCREKRWLICRTEFRGRRRIPMTPGHCTELFFLDEATALAAGHRPCVECRFRDDRRFKELWTAGNCHGANLPAGETNCPTAGKIDCQLQAERLNADGTKRTFQSACQNLPDGVLVVPRDRLGAFLVWNGALHHWTPGGYDSRRPLEAAVLVDVLTPPSTVRAIAAGYEPVVHPTAFAHSGRSVAESRPFS